MFSCIRTEYGDLRSNSQYSVRILEDKDPNTSYLNTFHAVNITTTKKIICNGLLKNLNRTLINKTFAEPQEPQLTLLPVM